MKIYNAYLFDADGTLFDTADLVCRCFQYVAQKYASISLTREIILSGYGLPLKGQLVTHLGADLDMNLILNDFVDYQLKILEDSVELFPGVKSTLEVLRNSGRKLAIVTSRKPTSLKRILEITDTSQYFDTLVTPEDTSLHKPNAEPALLALSRLGSSKTESVFIGDSQYDISCGSSAGMDTVFVNWSHMDSDDLPVRPTWEIDSFQDLIAEL
ncbi:MAG: HAD family hydrolase [Candidatus Marinimicrobia bacterium]|nr:HAD family hydrolase [Candidatus Neomarinimicrobiota bacterium]MCF7922941.1 HAD family hydrolase [Candidatus Neomarinimicrobiota bacterium]